MVCTVHFPMYINSRPLQIFKISSKENTDYNIKFTQNIIHANGAHSIIITKKVIYNIN